MLLADYQAYIEGQQKASAAYRDPGHWAHMSILNVARIGKFSSDRSIREYSEKIWNIHCVPVPVEIETTDAAPGKKSVQPAA